jgi:hypothetical protein
MKREFKVRWIGSGAPEKYAYIKLMSSVSYWNNPGNGAAIELGLPLIPAGDDPSDQASIVAEGKKIAKVKVGADGTAVFNVDNAVTVTSTATHPLASATNNGELNSSGTLTLKAIGLEYDSNYRRVDSVQVGPPHVYPYPACGEDFENQQAEVGVDPFEGSPQMSTALIRKGPWLLFPSMATLTPSVQGGSLLDTPYAQNASSIRFYVNIGSAAAMRQSSLTTTVAATQIDPYSGNEGPFTGKMTVRVWAIERILDKIPLFGRETYTIKEFEDGDPFKRISVGGHWSWSTTQVVTHTENSTTSLSLSPSVDIGPLKEIFKVGIQADGKYEWGHLDTKSTSRTFSGMITNPPDPGNNPLGLRKEWTIRVVSKHRDMWRLLGKYGLSGYEHDYSNTILNYDSPDVGTELHGEYIPD